MKILIEIGKLKKCKVCEFVRGRAVNEWDDEKTLKDCGCIPIKFEFNFHSLEYDCYGKRIAHFLNVSNDKIEYEWWFKNEPINWHRDDGPAVIRYNEQGKKEYKAWYVNGKFIKSKHYENFN